MNKIRGRVDSNDICVKYDKTPKKAILKKFHPPFYPQTENLTIGRDVPYRGIPPLLENLSEPMERIVFLVFFGFVRAMAKTFSRSQTYKRIYQG